MNINPVYKPLSLKELFKLARSISFKQRYPLPDLLSEIFETCAMQENYHGARQIVPKWLKTLLKWPDIVILTDVDQITNLLKQQKQSRPDIVSHAVEMVKGVPNVFTAQEKEKWRTFRMPMNGYLRKREIDESDLKIAKDVIDEHCVDGEITDVADFAAIYSARVFGETILGYGPHGCPGETKAYCQNSAMLVALSRKGLLKAPQEQLDMPVDRVSFLRQPQAGTRLTVG